MNRASLRFGIIRTCLVVGGFTLAAVVVAKIPAPAPVRAAGMLALPCVLFAVLRRQDRLLSKAASRARIAAKPRAPAAPARRKP